MYKRILLTLDGSTLAEQALPHAMALAKGFGAELLVLRVLEPLASYVPPTYRGTVDALLHQVEEEARALARGYLERIASDVRGEGLPVRIFMREGRAEAEITHFAEENQADLIVICSRGHSGFSPWLIGSVAERVSRGATVPVLLVRARREGT